MTISAFSPSKNEIIWSAVDCLVMSPCNWITPGNGAYNSFDECYKKRHFNDLSMIPVHSPYIHPDKELQVDWGTNHSLKINSDNLCFIAFTLILSSVVIWRNKLSVVSESSTVISWSNADNSSQANSSAYTSFLLRTWDQLPGAAQRSTALVTPVKQMIIDDDQSLHKRKSIV